MYRFVSAATAALILSIGGVAAQQSGGTAYPDNWTGGPPLPPVGYTGGQYVQPHVTYVQPQVQYAQPQYVQPRYVQPRYVQPQVRYVQPRPYVARGVYGVPAFQSVGPAVSGPPQSRCIVAILNNTAYGDAACSSVRINPADIPFLRQKFSNYQRNPAYALSLPSDEDYSANR